MREAAPLLKKLTKMTKVLTEGWRFYSSWCRTLLGKHTRSWVQLLTPSWKHLSELVQSNSDLIDLRPLWPTVDSKLASRWYFKVRGSTLVSQKYFKVSTSTLKNVEVHRGMQHYTKVCGSTQRYLKNTKMQGSMWRYMNIQLNRHSPTVLYTRVWELFISTEENYI